MYAPTGRKSPTVEIGPPAPMYHPAMYQFATGGPIDGDESSGVDSSNPDPYRP